MRQATDRGAFFRYWQDATEKGIFGPIHADHPQGGFYRHKHEGPVAIWLDQELDDGELAKPEEIKCLVGINGKAELVGFNRACEIWTWVAKHPIKEDDYRKAWSTGIWPGEDHGLPNRPADSFEELADQIDSAVSLIGLFPQIETKEDADRVANARDRLNELCAQAETLRKAEKKPFDDGAKAVQAKYKPYLDAATGAIAYCRSLLTPFLNKVAQEATKAAREAASAAGGESAAQAVQAPAVRVGGAGGRRTGLRTVTTVEITDYEACLAYVKNYEDVKAAVFKTASHLAKAGAEVPGVKVTKEKVAG